MREMVKVRHLDPFKPILLTVETPTIQVTPEQTEYIQDILEKSCSDSRFAQKAYEAINLVLTAGYTPPPEVTSLSPNTAALGSESFTLSVTGKNFGEGSQIIWNGSAETTTRVNDTNLTTGVDMSTAETAMEVPVMVQSRDGVLSNTQMFSLTPAARSGDQKSQSQESQSREQQKLKDRTETQSHPIQPDVRTSTPTPDIKTPTSGSDIKK